MCFFDGNLFPAIFKGEGLALDLNIGKRRDGVSFHVAARTLEVVEPWLGEQHAPVLLVVMEEGLKAIKLGLMLVSIEFNLDRCKRSILRLYMLQYTIDNGLNDLFNESFDAHVNALAVNVPHVVA